MKTEEDVSTVQQEFSGVDIEEQMAAEGLVPIEGEIYYEDDFADEGADEFYEEEFVVDDLNPNVDTGHTVRSAEETASFTMVAGSMAGADKHAELAGQLLYGNDAAVNMVLSQIQYMEDVAVQTALEQTVTDNTLDNAGKTAVVQTLLANKRKVDSTDIRATAADSMAAQVTAPSAQEAQSSTKRTSNLDTYLNTDRIISDMVTAKLLKIEFPKKPDISKLAGLHEYVKGEVGNFLENVAPFSSMVSYNLVYEDMTGEILSGDILAGEVIHKLKGKLDAVDGPDKVEYAEKLMTSIKNRSEYLGVFGHNAHIEHKMLSTLFSDVRGGKLDEEDIDWHRWLEDTFTVLDASLAAAAIRSGIKGIKALPPYSPASAAADANPRAASKMFAAALDSPSEGVANASGVTKGDIFLHTAPAPKGTAVKVAPDGVVKNLKDLERSRAKILETSRTAMNYTDGEKEAAAKWLQENLDVAVGGSYRSGLSNIHPTFDGIDAEMVFGLNEYVGYPSTTALEEGVVSLFGKGFKDYTVEWRNPVSGLLEPFNPDALAASMKEMDELGMPLDRFMSEGDLGYDLYVRANHKYGYNVDMMDSTMLFDGDLTIAEGTIRNRYTNDPDSMLSGFVNKVGISAFKGGRKLNNDLNKLVLDSLKPLGMDEKIAVMRTIEQGSLDKTVYDYGQLSAKGLNDKQIMSYGAIRESQEITYLLEDSRLVNNLRGLGAKQVRFDDSGYVNYATLLTEEAAIDVVKYSFDPATNAIKPWTNKEISTLYANGGTVGKLAYSGEQVGGQASRYISIDPTAGVKLHEVPLQGVLRYEEGYLSRLNAENYFVDVTHTVMVDGERTTKVSTKYVASTRQEAVEAVKQLNASSKEGTWAFRLDRDIADRNVFDKSQWNALRTSGALKVGHRGERLQHYDGRESSISGAVESLIRGNQVTAMRMAHSDATASLRQRVMNEYSDLMPAPDGVATYPAKASDITYKYDVDKERAHAAQRLVEYINLLERIDDPSKEAYRAMMMNIARWVGGSNPNLARETAEKGLIWASKHSPMNAATGLAFNVLLVAKPLRQFMLNATQHTFFVGLEPVYVGKGQWHKEGLAMGTALNTIDRPAAWAKAVGAVSKGLGMSEKEATAFVNNFKESGLVDVISSHSFARDGLVDLTPALHGNLAGKAGTTALNAVKMPLHLAQKYGFTQGEVVNKVMSYLLAAQRYRKEFPKATNVTDARAAGWISAEAESLALNMTQMGKFKYQEGWLKPATQFFSFQQKTLLNMLPEKLSIGKRDIKLGGSRRFTNAEKSRVATAQLALYGTKGIAGGAALYAWLRDEHDIDLSPAARNVVEGGIMDYTMNSILSVSTGEDVAMDISGTIAPSGGVYSMSYNLVYNLFNKPAVDAFFGASYSAASKIYDAATLVKYVFDKPLAEGETVPKDEQFTSTDKGIGMLKAAGTVIGQYDEYMKAAYAMRVGHIVDKTGDPVLQANFVEIFVRGLLSIKTKDEADFYHAMEAVRGKYIKTKKSSAATIAKQYYDNLTITTNILLRELPTTIAEAEKRRVKEAIEAQAIIWRVLDKHKASQVSEELTKLIAKKEMSSTKKQTLISNFSEILNRGGFGEDANNLLNKIRRMELNKEDAEAAERSWDLIIKNDEAVDLMKENILKEDTE